jgi:hypothetical protein
VRGLLGSSEERKTLVDLKEQLDQATFREAWERGRRFAPDAAVAMATSADRS